MRLYNTIFICKTLRPGLDVIIKSQGNGIYAISGWEQCRRSLVGLWRISCLEDTAKATMEALPEMEREKSADTITASEPRKAEFEKNLQRLKVEVDVLIRLYESLELGEAESGLDIKVPQCKTLTEYIGILQDIEFVLTQCPYITKAKEQVRFKSVDVGSQWLTFAVGAVAASGAGYSILSCIGSLVHKAIDIKSHILVYKQQEEYLKEEQAKRKIAEETVKFFKKFRKDALDKAVEELEAVCGELTDGEEKDKTAKCLEKLAVLIDKGVYIYSSIESPKEIKALFPMDEDNAILTGEAMKLIEDKAARQESDGEG